LSETDLGEDLDDLFETAPCGFLSARPDGRIVRINQTLADWLGRDREAVVGKPLYDILAFGSRIAFETHLAPLLRMQGHVHEVAIELRAANGEKVPAIVNAAEKRDVDGRHLFTRLAVIKAVDRRTYERTLVERRIAAEQEAEAERAAILLRDQFMAVLGHDLRNPLSAVGAGIDLLARREPLTDRGTVIVGEMKRSVARATALIDDLLDLARGSLGGGFIVERDADEPLAPVLEHVVAEVRAISPDHAIEDQIAVEEPVFCDRGRMAQLASNLLANAVTHGSAERPIRFEARTEGEMFILTVANAGEPIPPAAMEQLFHPFFRGEARPSRQGLGLGLYIVSEIAKAHGGELHVTSTEEETRFTFTMPRTQVA
jgi:sigma-B regulation protein RsbU (phosphoserine phosphatase)